MASGAGLASGLNCARRLGLEADFLDPLDLHHSGVVDDDLHLSETEGIDLFPDRFEPGGQSVQGIRGYRFGRQVRRHEMTVAFKVQ
jgi:hypothetical protein